MLEVKCDLFLFFSFITLLFFHYVNSQVFSELAVLLCASQYQLHLHLLTIFCPLSFHTTLIGIRTAGQPNDYLLSQDDEPGDAPLIHH